VRHLICRFILLPRCALLKWTFGTVAAILAARPLPKGAQQESKGCAVIRIPSEPLNLAKVRFRSCAAKFVAAEERSRFFER
jgi:hypothetical protein